MHRWIMISIIKWYITKTTTFAFIGHTYPTQSYIDISLNDGLVLDCSNSMANALELLQSSTKPSVCSQCEMRMRVSGFNTCQGQTKKSCRRELFIANVQLWTEFQCCNSHRTSFYVYGSQPLVSLQWLHNEPTGVSNHRRVDCLRNRLSRRRSKKISKLRVTGLCEGKATGDQ